MNEEVTPFMFLLEIPFDSTRYKTISVIGNVRIKYMRPTI